MDPGRGGPRGTTCETFGSASGTPWWFGVRGADWAHPGGSRSTVEGLDDHPVVHVSWNDAMAYCAWAERRLPTEAEWEFASRGGIEGAKYPWGDEEPHEGGWRANIWQGVFPRRNTLDDGWLTTAPVRAFAPNPAGVFQSVGNVWEWCADWFDPRAYERAAERDPRGPEAGAARVLRGCCAVAATCATSRITTATGTPRAARTRPTRRWATRGSAPSRCAPSR